MSLDGIIDPQKKLEIINRNAEKVYFQDLTNNILNQIDYEWKNSIETINKIENKYYNFDYQIKKSYNQNGNQILTFTDSGKKIQGYNYYSIQNQLKMILDIR